MRAPAPAVRVDLDAASYPAVLVGALVPVLIGVLAAAPVRLHWLTAVPTGCVLGGATHPLTSLTSFDVT